MSTKVKKLFLTRAAKKSNFKFLQIFIPFLNRAILIILMTLSDLLLSSDTHFVLFGGKGGVGKTTCAASAAVWSAEHGRKVLIISTDPAHSLADSLGQRLPLGDVTKMEEVDNLWGLEIKPKIDSEEMGAVLQQASPDIGSLLGSMGI